MTSLFDPLRQTAFVWKRELVLSREHSIPQALQSIVRDRAVLFRTENQADRRILIRECPVLTSIVQIEIHLSGVGVSELTNLQIDDNQATQPPIEKQQVDAIPLRAD